MKLKRAQAIAAAEEDITARAAQMRAQGEREQSAARQAELQAQHEAGIAARGQEPIRPVGNEGGIFAFLKKLFVRSKPA
ncbi:MAG: hypothetical protein UZ22_OP11002000442 [Microgenomates bacterium OLB23]|nr:MAG: hypothetical protein UZ22_OP11002000442 [Microgenomates bacterium OLB23]